jgi:transposase-like protein
MAVKRRVFSREFKLRVIHEIGAGKTQAQICREHHLNHNVVSRWCREHRQHKDKAFPGKAWAAQTDEARIANLERMVGRLTMENDLLKKVLQKLEEET